MPATGGGKRRPRTRPQSASGGFFALRAGATRLRMKSVVLAVMASLLTALLPVTQLTVVWAAGNYAVVTASDLPIGYWRLDETSGTTAADSSSGHANPLTYQGGY